MEEEKKKRWKMSLLKANRTERTNRNIHNVCIEVFKRGGSKMEGGITRLC